MGWQEHRLEAGSMDKPNALAFEYKREYGNARCDLDFFDIVNNPISERVSSILGLSFGKQSLNFRLADFGVLGDDSARPPLRN